MNGALLQHELRTVVAGIRRRPLPALLSVAMLALAIAANVAVFVVLSRTLFRPLRYQNPEEILNIYGLHMEPDKTETPQPGSHLEIVQWRHRSRAFRDIQGARPLGMTLSGTGEPESVNGAEVTGGLFRMFGVRPVLGRDFAPEEDVPQSTAAIITYELWQRRFGRDPGVIGRSIIVEGRPMSIVGVLPPRFELPTAPTEIFVPGGLTLSNVPKQKFWAHAVFGRLRPGVTMEQARSELQRISADMAREFPDSEKDLRAEVRTLRDAAYGDRRAALLVLWIAVILVQILACVNVANLMLAQITDQQSVTALRLVLGARPRQLMRLRVIEATLVSTAGGVLGFAVANVVLRFLIAGQPDLAEPVESAWMMPLFLLAAVIVTTLAIALVPAIREARLNLATVLREGSSRASSSVRSRRARELFIVGEIALAVPLLLAASVAVHRFRELRRVDIGFDAERVMVAQLTMPLRYDRPKRAAFAREIIRRVEDVPGVSSAGVTTNTFSVGNSTTTYAATDSNPELVTMAMRRISSGYFSTMRIPLRGGRAFTDDDNLDSPPVAIVSESLARKFWPGQNPIGKRIHRSPPSPSMIVVGVAPDVRDSGVGADLGPMLYIPYLQNNNIFLSLVVRTQGDPLSVKEGIRRAVWSLDRHMAPSGETPLRDLVDASLDADRLQVRLLTAFAVIAVILAGVGIYGVTAYAVSQRLREIGVRLAFGATPRDIVGELLGRATRSACIGLAVGVALALAAKKITALSAYGAAELDLRYAAAVAFVLFASAVTAALVPALRARHVRPVTLLRDA